MVQIIDLPNGQEAEFPDDMSRDQIQSVLRKQFGFKGNTQNDTKNIPNNNSYLEKAGQAAKYFNEGVRGIPKSLLELGAGATQGLANTGAGVNRLLTKGLNLIPGVNLPQGPTVNLAPDTLSSNVGEFIGSGIGGGSTLKGLELINHIDKIPYIANAIKKSADIIGKLPKSAQNVLNIGSEAAKGSIVGASMTPEDQSTGAVIGAFTPGSANALENAFESLKPSNIAAKLSPASHLSDEELLDNLKAAEGTSTSLGSVTDNAFMKKQYENTLSKFPLSTVNEKLQSVSTDIKNLGHEILGDLIGENNPSNVTEDISSALLREFKSHEKNKSDLYKKSNKIANDSNLNLELPTFSGKVKEYKDAIESTNLLKNEPDISRLLKRLTNYDNLTSSDVRSSPITGKSIDKPITLEEANLLKGKLNNYAKMASSSPDPSQRGLSKVFGSLASSLKSDIESSIESHGNEELSSAYKEAEDNYKNNFSQFLDKDIYRHLSGKADPNKIVSDFLKISKSSDQSLRLSKLTKKLSEKERKLIGYSYLSRSLDNEGNLNPRKLATLIDNIGENQLKTLIPEKNIQNKLLKFKKLYKMNSSAIDFSNPPTGQKVADLLPLLLAHAGTTISGGHFGGFPGIIAGLVGPSLLSRPLINALTSPEFRQKTVNAILKNRGKK